MKPTLSIARLTLASSWKFRLIQVMVIMLFGLLVVVPSLIHHNGSAEAFAQVFLTYSLGSLTVFLGFMTLWLACGSLSREVEDCQMQLVVTKPVARWQVWTGKWLGILAVNALLLIGGGACIYGLLFWSAGKLPEEEQLTLKKEILIARTALRETPADRSSDIERIYNSRLESLPMVTPEEAAAIREDVISDVGAMDQVVQPDYQRVWNINLGSHRYTVSDKPMQLRVRFHAAQLNAEGDFRIVWIASGENGQQLWREITDLTSDKVHEIALPPNLGDLNGRVTITAQNRSDTSILFPVDGGLELLFEDGSFGLNFARGIGLVFCWLAVLSALGLAAGSFLSFPVAAFFTLSALVVFFSTNLFQEVISEGTLGAITHEHDESGNEVLHLDESAATGVIRLVDGVMIPLFQGVVSLKESIAEVSPIEALSSGRSISWQAFLGAVFMNVILVSGLLGAFGIYMFHRRELATAQSKH